MHRLWCGKACCECAHPCKLDEKISCSPDCEFLGANGETDSEECKQCDANPARVRQAEDDNIIL